MNKKSNLLKNAMADLKISEPLQPQEFTMPKITQGPDLTGSNSATVKFEQSQELTVSKTDRVQIGQGQKRTPSEEIPDRVQSHYTKVPHHFLRKPHFTDPLCFMIYMHMYSLSYGFNKTHCDVSLQQMEKFTGAAKNTVKRALEKLIAAGKVRIAVEHSPHKLSRRYEVVFVESNHPVKNPQGLNWTESKSDSVQNEPGAELTLSKNDSGKFGQGQNQTGSGSNLDPVRGSKSDPLKEITINKKELSLELKTYLDSLPPAKHRQEERALDGLMGKYSLEQIQECYGFLKRNGEPKSGNIVHSPLAFLSYAMNEVMKHVASKKLPLLVAGKASQISAGESKAQLEKNAELLKAAEEKFQQAISDSALREKTLKEIIEGNPLARFVPKEIAEKDAILQWHIQQQQSA